MNMRTVLCGLMMGSTLFGEEFRHRDGLHYVPGYFKLECDGHAAYAVTRISLAASLYIQVPLRVCIIFL